MLRPARQPTLMLGQGSADAAAREWECRMAELREVMEFRRNRGPRRQPGIDVSTPARLAVVDCPSCGAQCYAETGDIDIQRSVLETQQTRPATERESREVIEQHRGLAIERLRKECPNHAESFVV